MTKLFIKSEQWIAEDNYENGNSKIMWISKKSILELIKETRLSYITKERLLKELGGEDEH